MLSVFYIDGFCKYGECCDDNDDCGDDDDDDEYVQVLTTSS